MSTDVAGGFVLTAELIDHVRNASLAGASLALGLCFFVCVTAAWVYSVPSARHHLDRVSFRLFMWSMAVEVVYTSCFIIVTRDENLPMNRAGCGTAVYFLLATMGVCNWLCTCIGINLMLAITFGINPLQLRLEVWYIIGSFLLGFGVPLVPAILGHFGFDPNYQACYFTEGEKVKRIRDFVLDLYFWQLLSCAVAAVSVTTVLVTLLLRSRATERALFRANSLAVTSSVLREITTSPSQPGGSSAPEPSTATWRDRLLHRSPGTRRRSHMHRLHDKLATIALKISLYPITLLLINVIITAEDLSYTSRGGLFSLGAYVMYWLHNFLYGGRGIFFALLGIIVDPCLRLGVPAAWRATVNGRHRRSQNHRKPDAEAGEQDGAVWNDAQSITNFLSTTGPGFGDMEEEYKDGETEAPTPKMSGRRGSPATWFATFRSGRGKDDMATIDTLADAGEMGSEKKVMAEDVAIVPHAEATNDTLGRVRRAERTSLGIDRERMKYHDGNQDLKVSIDIPTHTLPVRFSPTPTTSTTITSDSVNRTITRSPLIPNPDWIEPLATAVLARATSPDRLIRRSSDPALGATQRRKLELQAAAEELYAQAQMRL